MKFMADDIFKITEHYFEPEEADIRGIQQALHRLNSCVDDAKIAHRQHGWNKDAMRMLTTSLKHLERADISALNWLEKENRRKNTACDTATLLIILSQKGVHEDGSWSVESSVDDHYANEFFKKAAEVIDVMRNAVELGGRFGPRTLASQSPQYAEYRDPPLLALYRIFKESMFYDMKNERVEGFERWLLGCGQEGWQGLFSLLSSVPPMPATKRLQEIVDPKEPS